MPANQSTSARGGGGGGRQMTAAQANMAIRRQILQGGTLTGRYQPPAIDVWQPQNPPAPNNPGPGSVLTFYVRNVGLVKRLYVLFTGTITTPAVSGNALTLTPWGLANLVSNVSFFDLGNNQRINTTGWHLTAIATAKRRGIFGSNVLNDNPFGYGGACYSAFAKASEVFGNNVNGIVVNKMVQYAPPTIAADGGTGNFAFILEIPFVKNDTDLRGAIYADVTQATMQVQVTLNPNMFVPTGADPTLAVYQSASGSIPTTLTSFTYQVFQNYLDQLPRAPSGPPLLPQLDIATAYILNNSSSGLPVANQDNAAAFVNSRSYESVVFGYDNNGTLNTDGADINYIALQSANFTNIYQLNGQIINMFGRNVIGDDWPAGMYYLDFRHRPIDTNQFGNMQLVVNPSTVTGSGAAIFYGWEAYGIIGLVNQGGSIPLGSG